MADGKRLILAPRMFIADFTGLDFLNSIGTPEDAIVEWLANGEYLLAWLQEAKLIDPAGATAIRTKAFSGELDKVAAQARALREWTDVSRVLEFAGHYRGIILPFSNQMPRCLEKIADKDLRENRVYGASKSLFDYLIYYYRQSNTGNGAKLKELEQKMKAQIEEIQKMVSDLQKMILNYPAKKS